MGFLKDHQGPYGTLKEFLRTLVLSINLEITLIYLLFQVKNHIDVLGKDVNGDSPDQMS